MLRESQQIAIKTIETQIKLQNILDIPVLASYYENNMIEDDASFDNIIE